MEALTKRSKSEVVVILRRAMGMTQSQAEWFYELGKEGQMKLYCIEIAPYLGAIVIVAESEESAKQRMLEITNYKLEDILSVTEYQVKQGVLINALATNSLLLKYSLSKIQDNEVKEK